MKVLVTGASTLPGYRTALELANKGHQVFALYYMHGIQQAKRT